MDLIGGYLLIILVLFTANIGLILGNYKLDNLRLMVISLIFSIITFVLLNSSGYLTGQLSFLMDNLSYFFLFIAVVLFVLMFYYLKTNNFKFPLYMIIFVFIISTPCLSSQSNFKFVDSIIYSLFILIILFVVYQLTKLLQYAKRQYSIIIGEYMVLFSILIFIFALTYNSTKNLDYTMFSSFLILTPTYQLIYIIIAVIVFLVAGILINDTRGGNK